MLHLALLNLKRIPPLLTAERLENTHQLGPLFPLLGHFRGRFALCCGQILLLLAAKLCGLVGQHRQGVLDVHTNVGTWTMLFFTRAIRADTQHKPRMERRKYTTKRERRKVC